MTDSTAMVLSVLPVLVALASGNDQRFSTLNRAGFQSESLQIQSQRKIIAPSSTRRPKEQTLIRED